MDPLGVTPDIVDHKKLKPWSQIAPPIELHITAKASEEKKSPFVLNEKINKKVILWFGDIALLDTHAIVHSTNEALNDRNALSERIFLRAGPQLTEELLQNIKVCRTGEAKITKAYNLPTRYIIHTVGPKYNIKYHSAAEGALYSCYRNSLQVAREYKLPSVALTVINSTRRGYPPKDGAHIALRTTRRFLEKYGDSFETIVFAVEDDDVGIYEQLMPLYFPRNTVEEKYAAQHLPADVGNEDGEPLNPDRQIRIIDNPQHSHKRDIEESVDLLAELNTSVKVGSHDFARMTENADVQRQNPDASINQDGLTVELQRKNRYERLLRRARTEDLSEISGIGCLYQSGVDKLGRPVIVFVGKWMNFKQMNLDKTLLYLIYLLDSVVKQDYIIIYFHTITTSNNHPAMSWIKDVYNVLEYKYKKNLKGFYIVHPTIWTKLMTWWFTTFMAPGIKNKVQSLGGIEYLYAIMDMNQLDIPAFITEYDMTINGVRYYVPPQNNEGL